MAEPTYQIRLDLNEVDKAFRILIHSGDTPTVRVYLYEAGRQYDPPVGYTAQLGLGTDFEDSESMILVDGVQGAETPANYFDFAMTAADTGTPGDYYAQVIVKNDGDTGRWVFGRGSARIYKSPISGSPSSVTTPVTVVNLDLWEATGTLGGNLAVEGFVTGKKVGVFASLSAPTDTTITVADTYYPIAGTFSNDPLEGFVGATAYPPGIKYNESMTQYFEIDWHATVIPDSNTTTVHFAIKKNGVLVTSSIMGSLLKNNGQPYNLSGTCVIEMSTGDEIQLVVTADGNGDVLTIQHYTTSITEFFD